MASATPRRELQSALWGLENTMARAAKAGEEREECRGRKEDAERSCEELTTRKETLDKVSRSESSMPSAEPLVSFPCCSAPVATLTSRVAFSFHDRAS